MFSLLWVPNFIKIKHIAIFRPNLLKYNSGSRSAISNIIFMIKELDLLSVPNFIALQYISFLGPNFHGMRRLILYVECVFLDRNFHFLGGYYSLFSCYCWLLLVPWWLLLVTGGRCSLSLVTLVPTFSMNDVTDNWIYKRNNGILDSALTCSNLAVKTQSYQLLLSTLKHLKVGLSPSKKIALLALLKGL